MGRKSELETEGTSKPLGCASQSDSWAQNLPSHRNTGMLLSYCYRLHSLKEWVINTLTADY